MKNFDHVIPTRIIFGKDTEAQVGSLVKEYGFCKVLLHYGGGSVIKSGLLDRVKDSLSQAGVSFIELGGAQANPVLILLR